MAVPTPPPAPPAPSSSPAQPVAVASKPDTRPLVGSIDHLAWYIGKRGTGKTTLALADMKALAAKLGGAYMIAHDMMHRIPNTWPDAWGGGSTGLVHHRTVADAEKALRAGTPGVHVIHVGDGTPVLELGRRLGETSVGEWTEGKPPVPATPTLIMLDEAVGTSAMEPARLEETMRDFIAGMRHYHAALFCTTQQPQFAHYSLLSLATGMALGKVTDKRALSRLQEAGVDQAITELLPTLPPYQFYRVTL